MTSVHKIATLQDRIHACQSCPQMIGPVVTGQPVMSRILMVGQAPGIKEGAAGQPFAWTAGKTLFKWYQSIGISESSFRRQVYMAAVCRCYPGKNPKGGDRVPDKDEIHSCRSWLDQEIALLKPKLVIPVGKLAIAQFASVKSLADVVGQQLQIELQGRSCDMIALPHPSGLSTWFKTQPGAGLLQTALSKLASHAEWKKLDA